MRLLNRYTMSFFVFAGALAVFAFAATAIQDNAANPEEQFFQEVPLDQVAPGMPMGEMPMMPGGPSRPPAGEMPGGPPCMMGGPPMREGPGPRFPMEHGGPEHRLSVFHLLTHALHHADEFRLTNEERKALVGLRERLLYPAMEKEKLLEAMRFAFADTIEQPDSDFAKAREIAKKIATLESDLRELTITAATEVRKILGPERYAKLFQEKGHPPMMRMGMMMHGMGPRHGAPGGPPEPGMGPMPGAYPPPPPQ